MKVLLVDDESLARQRAARLLAEQALFECQRCLPDVLLLDISMPGMNGIELARHLATFQPGPAIVFSTAYDEYAIAALACIDETTQRQQLCATSAQGVSLLPVTAVRYFYADQNYVTAVHPDGELIIDDSLRELELEFTQQFVRVHRNALIALNYVHGIERQGVSGYRVCIEGVSNGPKISRRHLPALRTRLNQIKIAP
jgi:two-component system response regulator AlgR